MQKDDVIYRQAAIEALDEWFKKAARHPLSMSEYDSAYDQGEIDAYVTAIDTLKTLPSAQPDHVADVSKKVSISCGQENDPISRQMAINALDAACVKYDISPHYDDKRSDKEKFFDWWDMYKVLSMKILNNLPSTQPDNQINLCDSCDYLYPDCPSKKDDVIFGNGVGNDNICACNKYKPSVQPEQRWIPCSERLPEERGFYLTTTKDKAVYCDHWNEDNFDRTEMVIAWMPLPEPYRGGDE